MGSHRTVAPEARVLAASNRDLAAMVKEGTFRGDLFFRLFVMRIRIPALRERGDDVIELARAILATLATSIEIAIRELAPDAITAIRRYACPVNARELRAGLSHALVLAPGSRIEAAHLPEGVICGATEHADAERWTARLPASLAELETRAIEAALHAAHGNRTQAAEILGVNRATLYNKLRESGK